MEIEKIISAIETMIRCGVHRVQIPDSDIDFTSKNIAIWIDQNLLSRIQQLEQRQKWIDEVGRPQHPDDERPWVPAYLDAKERIHSLEEGIREYIKAMDKEMRNTSSYARGQNIAHLIGDLEKLLDKSS